MKARQKGPYVELISHDQIVQAAVVTHLSQCVPVKANGMGALLNLGQGDFEDLLLRNHSSTISLRLRKPS